MDVNAGRFVPFEESTPEMNKYEVGQLIEIRGDVYRIVVVDNVADRGQLVLRALSKADRERELQALREAFAGNNLSTEPRNRAERRQRDRELRRAMKR